MAKKNISIPEDSDVKEAFKQSLVDTLQESNTARNEMKGVLHELLKQPDTIKEIECIVHNTDRDAIKVFWKKFGFTVWSGIVFVTGIVTTVFIKKILGL